MMELADERDRQIDLMTSLGRTELVALMEEVDVVSFDFFDTLFVRPFAHPEDIFDVVGIRSNVPDFRRIRREAQSKAFRAMKVTGRREIRLVDIYRWMPSDLLICSQSIMEEEVRVEHAVLRPNHTMVSILSEAVSRGKQVAITSDMYLGNDFFDQIIARYGLPQVQMFISSECNDTKRDFGILFDVGARKLGVPHNRILHVGDNLTKSDISRARAASRRVRQPREAEQGRAGERGADAGDPARSTFAISVEAMSPRSCRS